MAKPSRTNIDSGSQNNWDTITNDNFAKLYDAPIPVYLHTGDESNLESTFPAAAHEECLVWVDHTTLGRVLYASDGTTWEIYGGQQMPAQADAAGWSDATAQADFNALLAKLRAAGRMAP